MHYSEDQKTYIEGVFERVFSGRYADEALFARYHETYQHIEKGSLTKDDLNRIANVLDLAMNTFTCNSCSKDEQRLLFECQMMTRFLLRRTA